MSLLWRVPGGILLGIICAVLGSGCVYGGANRPEVGKLPSGMIAFELPEGIGAIDPFSDSLQVLFSGDSLVMPSWSPSRAHLAFLRRRESVSGSVIRLADSAGSVIVNAASGLSVYQPPRWSPDGNTVVCGATDGALAIITPFSGGPKSIQLAAGDASFVSDSELVCTVPSDHSDSGTAVAIVGLDGHLMRIVADTTIGRFVLPRPVGENGTLSYAYNSPLGAEVWISPANGTVRKRLTTLNEPVFEIVPDHRGDRLLVISGSQTDATLYIVATESGATTTLTGVTCTGNLGAASWSPDGNWVAYSVTGGGIAIIDQHGQNGRTISQQGRNPNW